MVLFSMKTTKNAITHLKIKHNVGPKGRIVATTTPAQQTIQAAFGRSMPRILFNEDIFKELLLLWVIDANVSFRMCEQPSFRTLCAYLAACQPDYSGIYRALPQSGNAIKRYLLTWYEAMREEVKLKLRSTTVKIHFSFDMWSGPNQHAYQAIVAHWLDGSGTLHAALLSLHRFEGAHSGINQAEHLWHTLQLYDILPFVGMFNVDNASNNDTALVDVARRLRDAGHTSFDPIQTRLRCFGHVLNLVVKAILWGKDVEAFELNHRAAEAELGPIRDWQHKGPLKKLHNCLTYILKTPQRRDAFATVVKRVYPDETVHTVFLGNITRWSSDYESILRAFRLRDAIEEYLQLVIRQNTNGEYQREDPSALVNDELLPDDWDYLKCIKEILAPFREWSLRLQGRYSNGCVSDILPAMDELLSHLEDMKVQFSDNPPLVKMIELGWSILDKYVLFIPIGTALLTSTKILCEDRTLTSVCDCSGFASQYEVQLLPGGVEG